LISDPSGTKIRLCQLSPDPSYGGGVGGALNFRPVYVDDFSSVRPFSPDAANEPVALYLRAAEAPPAGSDFVFPFDRWYRRQARSRLSHTKSWAATEADDLNAESGLMGPIDPTDRASPWAPERRLSEVPLLSKIQQPAYRWGRGFETRGVDGILFVELDNPLPPSGHSPRTLTILTRPDLGKNTRHMTSYEAKIEPTLLWPLIKGSDVQPWRVRESGLYVIVAHDEEDPTRILTEEELIRVSGRLFDFLEPHLDMLRNRSLYRDRGAVGGPWGLSGPTEHLDAQAHVVMVRYIAAAGRPAAAVASPHVDPYLGRRTVSLPNNKTNVYFTRNEDEAYYLAGWVNSSPVQDALERFSAATGITPRALERLPVQRFDADDTNHVEVARLARVCTEKAQADDRAQLSEHWAQLDAVVAGMQA